MLIKVISERDEKLVKSVMPIVRQKNESDSISSFHALRSPELLLCPSFLDCWPVGTSLSVEPFMVASEFSCAPRPEGKPNNGTGGLMNICMGFVVVLLLITSSGALAHGGGLNAEGCHNDRKSGGYHCHRGSASPRAPTQFAPASPLRGNLSGGSVYYANCSAARAAGAAPVRRGDQGYGSHLDRDNDGVGCE